MKKVIVTGANGFLGRALIQKFVENKVDVLAIDISFSDDPIFTSPFITKLEKNLSDINEDFLSSKKGEYDTFYHFAWDGVNGTRKGDPIVQNNNVKNALMCAKIAKNIGCNKFLCSGTMAELSVESLHNLKTLPAGIMYAVAKFTARLMLEAYCKNVGLNFVWMQFSNVYGPQNKTGNLIGYTISQLLKNEYATFGPAKEPYDFIYIDDLITAVYRLGVVENSQSFYFIGSGKPMLLREYLIKIGEIVNKKNLIKIGERQDDGIRYNFEMFDSTNLVRDIGCYATKSFEENIKYTVENLIID